jgi:hypothetical protein
MLLDYIICLRSIVSTSYYRQFGVYCSLFLLTIYKAIHHQGGHPFKYPSIISNMASVGVHSGITPPSHGVYKPLNVCLWDIGLFLGNSQFWKCPRRRGTVLQPVVQHVPEMLNRRNMSGDNAGHGILCRYSGSVTRRIVLLERESWAMGLHKRSRSQNVVTIPNSV